MMRFLLFHLLVLACIANSGSINVTTDDQDALLSLRAHFIRTHDPTNFFAKNWNTTSTTNIHDDVCNWTRVTCDDTHSRLVIALNLSRLNLTGTVPAQIGNLSSLQTLDLSFNHFVGPIPSSIFTSTLKDIRFRENHLSGTFPSFNTSMIMSSLQHLDLSHNTFSGEIPANICSNLPFMEYLSLSKNMFHGEIPSTLSNCGYLEILSLSINNFSGGIPKEIGNLIKLKEVYLGFNKLQGGIPREFGSLTALEMMQLSQNNLRGEIPKELGNLTELETVDLSDNYLTGIIPSSIYKISSLLVLVLEIINLTGEIPHEIGNLHNLEWLSLSHNKLVGVVPSTIFNVSTLKLLQLQNNSLSGRFPTSTRDDAVQLPNLELLCLWSNNFSGTIPSFIFNNNASKLSILELQINSFSGSIPNTFGNLRNLHWLSLHDNILTSSTPELSSFLSSLSNCKYLKVLDLSYNPLNAILPSSSLGNLSHSLEQLWMFGCNISGGIPEDFINNFTNLTTIELGGNKLNGSIPITLGKLKNLQYLNLQDNKLEGSIPNAICRLPALYFIDLSGNKLSGSMPACFGEITSLRELYLGSNELTYVIPSTLWELKDILYINFSSNLLSGPLQVDIGSLKALVGIDLSNNNLSGVIPTTIGGLNQLQYLFLGYNALQGLIPDSVGGLISLQSLNLSHNYLSGPIPLSLEKLSDLKDLNLSFNNLEGEIPRGGSFGNFSAKSFEGNKLLCGSPNLQVPPCKANTHHKSRKNKLLLGIVLPLSTMFMVVIIFLILKYRKRGAHKLSNDGNMSLEATQRRFSYLQLFRATDGFNENHLIGKGSFGSVYKARLQNGIEVAVKVFHLQFERALRSFDIECEVMRSIRHRNLVKIITSCSNEDYRMLVLEYMRNGSLEKGLYSSTCVLDIFQRLNIMIDVASALEYLHFGCSPPIIHCDLKPSNVLLDESMVAHLSDFGIAKLLTGEDQSMTQTETFATLGYMAPEYGREGRVSTSGDVYSFGIMLMETFSRKKPTDEFFTGEMTLKHWVHNLLPLSVLEVVDPNLLSQEDMHFAAKEEHVPFVYNLAMECTEESPEQRINAKEIVTRLLKIRDSLLKNARGRGMRQSNFS